MIKQRHPGLTLLLCLTPYALYWHFKSLHEIHQVKQTQFNWLPYVIAITLMTIGFFFTPLLFAGLVMWYVLVYRELESHQDFAAQHGVELLTGRRYIKDQIIAVVIGITLTIISMFIIVIAIIGGALSLAAESLVGFFSTLMASAFVYVIIYVAALLLPIYFCIRYVYPLQTDLNELSEKLTTPVK